MEHLCKNVNALRALLEITVKNQVNKNINRGVPSGGGGGACGGGARLPTF